MNKEIKKLISLDFNDMIYKQPGIENFFDVNIPEEETQEKGARKMSNFTPGKWITKTVINDITKNKMVIVGTETNDKDFNFNEAICLEVFHTNSQNNTQLPGENYQDMMVRLSEANARLIAAAPEMYHKLIECYELLQDAGELLKDAGFCPSGIMNEIKELLDEINDK